MVKYIDAAASVPLPVLVPLPVAHAPSMQHSAAIVTPIKRASLAAPVPNTGQSAAHLLRTASHTSSTSTPISSAPTDPQARQTWTDYNVDDVLREAWEVWDEVRVAGFILGREAC